MRNKIVVITAMVSFCLGSNNIMAQAIYDPVTHTSMLPGGMTFARNMQYSTAQSFSKDFDQYSMRQILGYGHMMAFGTEYGTKGTRLLFNEWVKGEVVKNSGEVIDGEKYFFNFDKISGNLIVTIDKDEVIEVYKDSIKSFKFREKGRELSFEKIVPIQRYRFVQVLVNENGKFNVYKSINTRFVGADFQTDGLKESGNPYDEYVDANNYFIMYQGEVRPVKLNFSSIKKALKENLSKAREFYAEHIMDDVDENYLIHIVQYVNQ